MSILKKLRKALTGRSLLGDFRGRSQML